MCVGTLENKNLFNPIVTPKRTEGWTYALLYGLTNRQTDTVDQRSAEKCWFKRVRAKLSSIPKVTPKRTEGLTYAQLYGLTNRQTDTVDQRSTEKCWFERLRAKILLILTVTPKRTDGRTYELVD